MSEVKWIKIVPDIFEDDKMLLIDDMQSADSIIVIWFKLLCLAGKLNSGATLMLNDKIAYNEKMLASVFHRKEATVKRALDTFESLGMISRCDGAVTITNWDKHQNVEGLDKIREKDRLRKQKKRSEQKRTSADVRGLSADCPRIEEEEEEEEEEEKEIHSFILSKRAREESADKNADISADALKQQYIGGHLGGGVVMLSEEQFNDLCERLSLDELNKYIGIVRDCELSGQKYRRKTHYQAILDMASKDRMLEGG